MNFEDALSLILTWEGGYTNHPSDPGKATNMGVTIGTLSEVLGRLATDEDVRKLQRDDVGDLGWSAASIYAEKYWNPCRCGEMPPGLDLLLFDAAVNHGIGGAKRMLQEALKVKQDAILGPATMAAIAKADRVALLCEFSAIRADLYETINKTFERGWYRRQFALFAVALTRPA